MSHHCFHFLCQQIISKAGKSNYKFESFIDTFLKGKDHRYDAHCESTGDYVASKVKLAIAVRLLAGGDAYGLSVIFDAHFDYVNMILSDMLL